MNRARAYSLWVSALAAGIACYVLLGQQRTQEIAVVIWMLAMVFWFHHRDHEIDSYPS